MDANLEKRTRLNTIAVIVLLITAFIGINIFLSIFVSGYNLSVLFAIIILTVAIALPISQKRFSFYTIFLVVGGILVLISGVIDNAYYSVMHPLSVSSQIEFSKIMRPTQVSRGLLNVGSGISLLVISSIWLSSKKMLKSSGQKTLLILICGIAILVMVFGITAIVEGLGHL